MLKNQASFKPLEASIQGNGACKAIVTNGDSSQKLFSSLRPTACVILDIAKISIARFISEFQTVVEEGLPKETFQNTLVELITTDTDSAYFNISCHITDPKMRFLFKPAIEELISKKMKHCIDYSNYEPSNKLFNETNAKRFHYFQKEHTEKSIVEILATSPKEYCKILHKKNTTIDSKDLIKNQESQIDSECVKRHKGIPHTYNVPRKLYSNRIYSLDDDVIEHETGELTKIENLKGNFSRNICEYT